MSNPTYRTSTLTFAASGLRRSVATSTDAAPRLRRFPSSQDSVSPESMMSSTMRTLRPWMSVPRSFRIRTTPEERVPEPYDETAIQSMRAFVCSLRARSAIAMTAPLSTPTRRRSLPA